MTGWRDRVGGALVSHRWLAVIELLIVPATLSLKLVHLLRNPSLIFLVVGWLSLWLRRSGWRHVGLTRPKSWPRTLLLGVAIGIGYNLLDIYAILPLLRRLTGTPLDLSGVESLKGNLGMLLGLLGATWTLFAFGEEMAYRGYLFNRLGDVLGTGAVGRVATFVLVSLAFGAAHSDQGITGVMDNVLGGAVLVALYVASGRNLWLPIVAHGVEDTMSLVLLYNGFRPPA